MRKLLPIFLLSLLACPPAHAGIRHGIVKILLAPFVTTGKVIGRTVGVVSGEYAAIIWAMYTYGP